MRLGRTMKLLVTGGAGFIGSNFIRMIVAGEMPEVSGLIVLDKLTYAGNLDNFSDLSKDSFEFIKGDICDPDIVRKLTKRSDAIINFAAESHVDNSISDSVKTLKTNTLGTQVLLEAARKFDLEQYVQISTDEVYGSILSGSWNESEPLLPNSPYSASKASADLVTRAYHKTFGLDTRITRCSNNYGPFQFPEKVIPLFVTNLLENKSIPLYGDGRNIREWIHVSDHCRGIYSVLTKGKAGEIYNFGTGIELTNKQLTLEILEKMGFDESRIEKVSDRLGHDFRYSVDWSKSNKELDFVPQISWEKGLQETIDWYVSHEHWWKPLKS